MTGYVEQRTQRTVGFSCPMNFAQFPFDTQTCTGFLCFILLLMRTP
jgi:hypothetical protein